MIALNNASALVSIVSIEQADNILGHTLDLPRENSMGVQSGSIGDALGQPMAGAHDFDYVDPVMLEEDFRPWWILHK